MIEKITDQNLERYDSRLKEWCDRKFFEKGNYGKYETTEEASAVAFYPAPNTPLEGKVKFSFKETMPVSGYKGPDNPSTIEGISSIDIKLTNKNLISLPYHTVNKTSNGITWTINSDNTITANGTATAGSIFYCTGTGIGPTSIGSHELVIKPNTNYFLSGCPANGSATTYKMYISYGTGANYHSFQDIGNGCVFNVPQDFNKGIIIRCSVESGTTVENLVFRPQLEEGTAKTDWEVINREKTIISLGNTYYGGEIDLATGVMIITYRAFELTPSNLNIRTPIEISSGLWNVACLQLLNENTVNVFGYKTSSGYNGGNYFCNILDWNGVGSAVSYHFSASNFYMTIEADSDSAAISYITNLVTEKYTAGTPVFAGYPLATPYTVQLTSTEILSLIQADKYTPRINTIYTDADSIQISYLKSPIRDEYEKTQVILSLGGNS